MNNGVSLDDNLLFEKPLRPLDLVSVYKLLGLFTAVVFRFKTVEIFQVLLVLPALRMARRRPIRAVPTTRRLDFEMIRNHRI